MRICICRKSLTYFLCKYDVIEIGLKQKGKIWAFFNQLWVQCLLCMIFNLRQLDTCSKLPATFALFPVLSLKVFYVTKIPGSPHLQCSCSGVWEPGNEARCNLNHYFFLASLTSSGDCCLKGECPRLHISYISTPKLQMSLAAEYLR